MAVEKGSAFLLKVGDGAVPPGFATVAGLRTTQLSVNGQAVEVTSKDSGGWRELLSGAGVRSVSVSAAGVFTGSAAEVRVRGSVLAGTVDAYAPGPGTLVEVVEGCDKAFATCRDRFANAANFRGEPFLPGIDLLTRYPGA